MITGRIARQLAEHLAPFPVGVGKFDARYTAIFRRMASFGMHKILSRAEVSFRGLNRRVAEQQLNLLKLAARSAAQLRACTPEVMWRDTGDTEVGSVLQEHLPDDLLAQSVARYAAAVVHRAEYVTRS